MEDEELKRDSNDSADKQTVPRPSRHQFLKGLTTGTVAIGALTQSGCAPAIPALKTRGATVTTTVCPFCGVGCGQVVSSRAGKVIHIEGDPAHPISAGTLCSKGAAGIQVVHNSRRLQKVLYRKPNGVKWEEKSWDWAFERIAARVKETRSKTFKTTVDGRVVNRTEAIACLGGSALDNEEAYPLAKLMRSLGLVYLDHQARLSTVVGLAASFGRGAMTNHWVDMLNADVVLVMGGNPAEDHPISMNWLARAKEQGTYILHVDPRFNRTSSIADVFAKMRSGTDIAFVGGMIHYAIANNRIQEEYVREYPSFLKQTTRLVSKHRAARTCAAATRMMRQSPVWHEYTE